VPLLLCMRQDCCFTIVQGPGQLVSMGIMLNNKHWYQDSASTGLFFLRLLSVVVALCSKRICWCIRSAFPRFTSLGNFHRLGCNVSLGQAAHAPAVKGMLISPSVRSPRQCLNRMQVIATALVAGKLFSYIPPGVLGYLGACHCLLTITNSTPLAVTAQLIHHCLTRRLACHLA
jgi:hypothetical protein